ncbi:hypothetical protein CBM2626_B50082 [Cupriavidus taiwanensis]|uniref:Uncharacterized protein n=1 Tax=Cupriavidus taiwanensis TaxID=164546 RepID=A0A375EEG8_9BURK|nr:hypothetical protein CBM2614_B60049 [Cupriavidus taiwanensis]SOZ70169.1 hypothetical protein CBM2615_B70048 [Cupriavidus taiwanensis]SOZ73037.1 hypothetical protein CBM2613_B50179 [Cupriavidus taiwanensis]SPA02882.1 hypothetical protein CBM2626_B50082 [Cupriavidus taiwanensis]SPA09939.1 hypothetical protein CBM2625_B60095 [Cupriavidus taiwanensis]
MSFRQRILRLDGFLPTPLVRGDVKLLPERKPGCFVMASGPGPVQPPVAGGLKIPGEDPQAPSPVASTSSLCSSASILADCTG